MVLEEPAGKDSRRGDARRTFASGMARRWARREYRRDCPWRRSAGALSPATRRCCVDPGGAPAARLWE